ncbi:hypothetical protein BDD26_1991 [Xenorhabdus cabanillasii]|uniref:SUKH superfamily protein n=1 Tax=Xenorhabdus cabanillasii TaxID=351673 RepID=A0A3D9UKX0_9GAMM|nr:SMI1/KNR4 family protein [Xenorhabdus cabanillasii]REF27235.1 hypothetical protein BDD26_1991 [Xenorhabdus cabanillasii]
MTKTELIEYLHSAYPELTIDITYIKGYSEEDIVKLERLYDIKIQGQLLDFLIHMGRCSGGFFSNQPLSFYSKTANIRDEIKFQIGCEDGLREVQRFDLIEQKPFFISMENEGIFHYFLLTDSVNPDLVYYLDTNYDTIVDTSLTFNEYLRSVVDSSRSYTYKIPPDYMGDLLRI